MKKFFAVSMIGALALPFAMADEAHLDVSPGSDGSKIITGGFDHDTDEFTPDIRVFPYEFGEIPLQPFFAEDPGFNNFSQTDGGTFPANADLGFNITDNLLYWDGTGSVTLDPIADATTMIFELGSQSATIGGSTALPVSGFTVETSNNDGAIEDTHFDVTLDGPGLLDPANGIYVVEAVLTTNVGLADSDPIWWVFNLGLDEVAHEAAEEYVENVLVPEPTSLVLLTLAGLLIRRR